MEEYKLPQFVNDRTKDFYLCGVPAIELSKEELVGAIAYLYSCIEALQKRHENPFLYKKDEAINTKPLEKCYYCGEGHEIQKGTVLGINYTTCPEVDPFHPVTIDLSAMKDIKRCQTCGELVYSNEIHDSCVNSIAT